MAYILGDIVDSIETTLSAAASLVRSQSYDELTEGIHEYPLLQVYPSANTGTSRGSETDRFSFEGPVPVGAVVKHLSVKEYIIHADLYARQRSHINEDMEQLVDTINELEDILDGQDPQSLFGRADLFSFRWSWSQVTFEYAGVMYLGARFIITVRAGKEH